MQKLNIQQLPVDDTKSSSDNLWSSAKNKLELDSRIQNKLDDVPLDESAILAKLVANPNTKMNGVFYNNQANNYCYYEGLYTSKTVSGQDVHYGYCMIKGIHDSDYNYEFKIDWEDSDVWVKSEISGGGAQIDDSSISTETTWSSNNINDKLGSIHENISDLQDAMGEIIDDDISSTQSTYSSNKIESIKTGLQESFQDGVNTIYNAVVSEGVTPDDKSPSEIAEAIPLIKGVIDDSNIALDTTYSSSKVNSIKNELQSNINALINDSVTTTNKTYSSRKIQDIANDLNAKIVSASGSFSTNEVLTGYTWIDGRPIYRKVYTGVTTGTTGNAWTNVGVSLPSGVVNFIKGYAVHVSSNNYRDSAFISIAVINGVLKYWTDRVYTTNVPNMVIIEYTK